MIFCTVVSIVLDASSSCSLARIASISTSLGGATDSVHEGALRLSRPPNVHAWLLVHSVVSPV